MNITEKLKINNELFGEKTKTKTTKTTKTTTKKTQGTMNNLDPIIQLLPPNISA